MNGVNWAENNFQSENIYHLLSPTVGNEDGFILQDIVIQQCAVIATHLLYKFSQMAFFFPTKEALHSENESVQINWVHWIFTALRPTRMQTRP